MSATWARPWKHKVDLSDVWADESLTFEQRRDAIVRRLRAGAWTRYDLEGTLDCLLDELAEAENEDDFNAVWAWVYDWADADKRLWIDLWGRS